MPAVIHKNFLLLILINFSCNQSVPIAGTNHTRTRYMQAYKKYGYIHNLMNS